MQRPDSSGHVLGRFSEGNPGTGTPATVLSAKQMNMIVDELVNLVESAGLTVVADGVEEGDLEWDNTQVSQAVSKVANSTSQKTDLLNNQTVKVPFGGAESEAITLDKTLVRSAEINYEIYRTDAVDEIKAIGKLVLTYKPKADTFVILGGLEDRDGQDHGVEFFLENVLDGDLNPTDIFALNYKSSDLTGGSYVGNLTYSLKTFLN